MCSTSLAGYQFAMQLKAQHDKEVEEQKQQNTTELPEITKDTDSRRQVGEIDYAKHEETIKKLEREDEIADHKAKALDAASWCPLDHEHGPNCVRPKGDCSHNHQKEIAIYERPTEDKIKAAKQFREAGNKLFKEQNYGLACVEYRKGLLQYDYTFPEGDEEILAVDQAKLALHLNLAACKIQLDDYNEALTNCRCALQIDPNSCKALYRRGIAQMGKLDFDEAKTSFLDALSVEPNNKTVHTALVELKDKIAEYDAKTRKVAEHVINAKHDTNDETAKETEEERRTRYDLEEMEGINVELERPRSSRQSVRTTETGSSLEGSIVEPRGSTSQTAHREELDIPEQYIRRRKEPTEPRPESRPAPVYPPIKELDGTQKLVMGLFASSLFFACTTICLAYWHFF